MNSTAFYRENFIDYLNQNIQTRTPENLYDPMVYILNIGGKRLRPVSVLMATELFGVPYQKGLDAALAVEIFHNFSLVHDDIMDDAPVRRGRASVHEKWNLNTAILSGDAMLIYAYQLFENYEGDTFKALAKLFTKTAIQVCEGQQFDIDFEERDDVQLEEYLKMIEYKTAVLVGAAMEMGAIVAGASVQDRRNIYKYGCLLGLAFQLQDDYLDIFGDFEKFGKQIGGDIIENKKTFLYISALQAASASDAQQLRHLYSIEPSDPLEKIETVTALFEATGAAEKTREKIKTYTQEAFELLESMNLAAENKAVFRAFGDKLMYRTS